jgi:hypothetical protein
MLVGETSASCFITNYISSEWTSRLIAHCEIDWRAFGLTTVNFRISISRVRFKFTTTLKRLMWRLRIFIQEAIWWDCGRMAVYPDQKCSWITSMSTGGCRYGESSLLYAVWATGTLGEVFLCGPCRGVMNRTSRVQSVRSAVQCI